MHSSVKGFVLCYSWYSSWSLLAIVTKMKVDLEDVMWTKKLRTVILLLTSKKLLVYVSLTVMSHVLTGDVLLFCCDCTMTELSYLSVASLTLSCEVTDDNLKSSHNEVLERTCWWVVIYKFTDERWVACCRLDVS